MYGLTKILEQTIKVEQYEAGEPVSDHTKVAPTNFQPVRVDNGALGAELKVESNLLDDFQNFKLTLLNQSGKPFQPERAIDANVTFHN